MSLSSKAESLFASSAVALLCELEQAAEDVGGVLTIAVTAQGRLQIAPRDVLTEARAALIREHKDTIRLLVWCCDDGVRLRREVFGRVMAQAVGSPGLPALRYRDDVPVEAGRCVSCGDATAAPVWCWRCQLAARLAIGGDVPVNWQPVGGAASASAVAA